MPELGFVSIKFKRIGVGRSNSKNRYLVGTFLAELTASVAKGLAALAYGGMEMVSDFALQDVVGGEILFASDNILLNKEYIILYEAHPGGPMGAWIENLIPDFIKNSSDFTLSAPEQLNTNTPQPEPELPRHMKIGGVTSPRPVESLYLSTVNANKPIPTIRTGGATFLPAGEGVTAYEVGCTFIGLDEINNVLRRWIASIHHSPILELIQDDIAFLSSEVNISRTSRLQDTLKNDRISNMQKVFNEAKRLLANNSIMVSIQHALNNAFGSQDSAEVIDNNINFIGDLQMLFEESKSVNDLVDTHRFGELSTLAPQLNTYLKGHQLTTLVNELLTLSINIFDLYGDSQQLIMAIKQEEDIDPAIERYEGSDRLVVACQHYRISTVPENPLALNFSATFLKLNHHHIAPRFRYRDTNGRPVETVEQSAFFDWVGRSLYNDNGIPSGSFLSRDVPEFYFSRFSVPSFGLRAGGGHPESPPIKIFMPEGGDTSADARGAIETVNQFGGTGDIIDFTGTDIAVKSIQLQAAFQFTPVQIEASVTPFYQYMGLHSTDVVLSVATKNRDLVKKIMDIPNVISHMARRANVYRPFLIIQTDLLGMVDFRACVPQSVQVVPDAETIDTWNLSIQLVKYSDKSVEELQGGMSQTNEMTSAQYTRAFNDIILGDNAPIHKQAIRTLLESIVNNTVKPWPRGVNGKSDVYAFLNRVEESAIAGLLEKASIYKNNSSNETTKVDLETFWIKTGIWLGPTIPPSLLDPLEVSNNVAITNQSIQAASDQLSIFDTVNLLYKRINVAIPFEGLQAEAVTNNLGKFFAFTTLHEAATINHDIVDDYLKAEHGEEESLPYKRRVPGNTTYSLKNKFDTGILNLKYNNVKAKEALIRRHGQKLDETLADTFGELGNAWHVQIANEEIGYFDFLNRTVFDKVRYFYALTLQCCTIDQNNVQQPPEAAHSLALDFAFKNFNFTGKSVMEVDDQLLYCVPRLAAILNNFMLYHFDAEEFTTDPIFGHNIDTYPDLRLPQYKQYNGFLTETDNIKNKDLESFMNPDWYFDYAEHTAAVENLYNTFKAGINSNVDFTKQLLANRYSEHIAEHESTSVTLRWMMTMGNISVERAIAAATFPYIPVPKVAITQMLKELEHPIPSEFLTSTTGAVEYIRVRGLWANDKLTSLREMERLEQMTHSVTVNDPNSAQATMLKRIQREVNDKIRAATQLGDAGASETYVDDLWRRALTKLYEGKVKRSQQMEAQIPLTALTYIVDDESFGNLMCEQKEIRNLVFSMDSERVISYTPEPDPMYNAYTEEEIDGAMGGSFLAQAYGNTPLMMDKDAPQLEMAHFREDKLGTAETLEAHRILAENDERSTEVFGFAKCYPTYFILFYREDGIAISQVYNFYKAAGVTNIQVHHDKHNPISLATITLSNPFDTLFRSEVEKGPRRSLQNEDTKPPLTVGMGVQIKLGYDGNSENLETVFTGQITEMSYGTETQIVCQSWGIELTFQNGTKGFWDEEYYSALEDSLSKRIFTARNVASAMPGVLQVGLRFALGAETSFLARRLPSVFAYSKSIGVVKYLAKHPHLARSLTGVGGLTGASFTGATGAWGIAGGIATGGMSIFITIAAGMIVGAGVEKWLLPALENALFGQRAPSNAPYYLLDKKVHIIEQYLTSHIFSDIRIKHFNTPLYLGIDHMSPKTQNIYFPTSPEIWEAIASQIETARNRHKTEYLKKNFGSGGDPKPADETYKNKTRDATQELIKDKLTIRNANLRGREFDFLFKNMTAWEGLGELTRRYPGLEMACRPFDYRSTLFIGRPDRLYRYTERRDTAFAEWVRERRGLNEPVSINKLKTQINVTKQEFILLVMEFMLSTRHWKILTAIEHSVSSTVLGRERDPYVEETLAKILSDKDELDNPRKIMKIPHFGDPAYIFDSIGQGLARWGHLPKDGWEGMTQRLQILREYVEIKQSRRGFSADHEWFGQFAPEDGFWRKLRDLWEKQASAVSKETASVLSAKLEAIYEAWDITRVAIQAYNKAQYKHPHMRPFRRYHLASSVFTLGNIVKNDIKTSDENVYNQVNIGVMNSFEDVGKDGSKTPKNWTYVKIAADPTIPQSERRTIDIQCRTTSDTQTAMNIGISALKGFMAEMYQGQLTQLGEPGAFPLDRVVLGDEFNSMAGVFEIKTVSHIFNSVEGFVTSYSPNAIVYAQDYLGLVDYKSMKMRKLARFWAGLVGAGAVASRVLFKGAPLGAGVILPGLNLLATGFLLHGSGFDLVNEVLAFTTGEDPIKQQSPLVISPLIKGDTIMLAGMNGFRWDLAIDRLDDNSLMRRFNDYLKITGTGFQEWWRDRQGFYLTDFGEINVEELRRRDRAHSRWRLTGLSTDEQVTALFGTGE